MEVGILGGYVVGPGVEVSVADDRPVRQPDVGTIESCFAAPGNLCMNHAERMPGRSRSCLGNGWLRVGLVGVTGKMHACIARSVPSSP